jgi:hypothetical protein
MPLWLKNLFIYFQKASLLRRYAPYNMTEQAGTKQPTSATISF